MSSTLIGILFAGYIVGSIPFGMIFAALFGLGNLRKIGSGNIGATNVLRAGNKNAAALTLLFDMGKGILAVLVAEAYFGPYAGLIAGLGAFLGHIFPIWLGFHGGKGVATFLGVMLAVNPLGGAILCAIWLGMAYFRKISSLAALTAAVAAPFVMGLVDSSSAGWLGLSLGALVWMRHSANVQRLLNGTEPRIGEGA